MVLLQEKVSRSDSIKIQARQYVNPSLAAFFTEHVPFSLRNGPVFANRLATVLIQMCRSDLVTQKLHGEEIHILELGCGLGFTSRFLIRYLKEQAPDLYSRMVFHITDNDANVIKHLLNNQLEVEQNVRYEVLDALHSKIDYPVYFAFSNYLLDTFDAVPCRFYNGDVQEWKLDSYINNDAVIFDTTVFPPKLLAADQIKNQYQQDPKTFLKTHVKHLNYQIQHQFHLSDFNKNHHDYHHILRLCKAVNASNNVSFNYSPDIAEHLKWVGSILHDDGVYVLSDFGVANELIEYDPELLVASYGKASFNSVNFPFLTYIADEIGYSVELTSRPVDNTQECILSKRQRDLSSAIKLLQSDSVGYENIASVIEKIDDISESNDIEDFTDLCHKATNSLNQYERDDYLLLKTLAYKCYYLGYYNLALIYLKDAINLYHPCAYDFYILTSWVGMATNEYDAVGKQLFRAKQVCDTDSYLYSSLAMLAMSTNELDRALKLALKSLRLTRDNQIWDSIEIIKRASDLSGTNHSKQLTDWQHAMEMIYPSLKT